MSFSKDVKLESGGTILYFKYLTWDTKFFGKNSFILDMEKSRIRPCGRIRDLFGKAFKNCFISVKLDSVYGREALDFMQSLDFKYIDTEVILKYCGAAGQDIKCARPAKKIKILELKENKGLPYEELGSSFDKTRFHSDAMISTQKADELWISYIKNYKITPLQHMFVASSGGKIAGAILAGESKDRKEATLSFVAVLTGFKGMGIGSRLIGYAQESLKGTDLFTETQVSNKEALSFYIKNGFRKVEKVKTILHRW